MLLANKVAAKRVQGAIIIVTAYLARRDLLEVRQVEWKHRAPRETPMDGLGRDKRELKDLATGARRTLS